MFSVAQKRAISTAVQKILRDTNHPELPREKEVEFNLHVYGANNMLSWADIQNNGSVESPTVNPWNESQDPNSPPVMGTKDGKIERSGETAEADRASASET